MKKKSIFTILTLSMIFTLMCFTALADETVNVAGYQSQTAEDSILASSGQFSVSGNITEKTTGNAHMVDGTIPYLTVEGSAKIVLNKDADVFMVYKGSSAGSGLSLKTPTMHGKGIDINDNEFDLSTGDLAFLYKSGAYCTLTDEGYYEIIVEYSDQIGDVMCGITIVKPSETKTVTTTTTVAPTTNTETDAKNQTETENKVEIKMATTPKLTSVTSANTLEESANEDTSTTTVTPNTTSQTVSETTTNNDTDLKVANVNTENQADTVNNDAEVKEVEQEPEAEEQSFIQKIFYPVKKVFISCKDFFKKLFK